MTAHHPKVDAFIGRAKQWQSEMQALRAIFLKCGLVEDLKWGQPTYTHNDHNILIIHCLKDSCAPMFFKGTLMSDPDGVLVPPGENSQAAARIHFQSVADIAARRAMLESYVKQAIDIDDRGLKVDFKEKADLVLADELVDKLDAMPELSAAFNALTPGRQRAYNLYFTGAKQTATRAARVEKHIPRILEGKGIADP